jgi:hypothetical protein
MSVKLHTPTPEFAISLLLSFRKLPISHSIALTSADFVPGPLIALIS